MDKISSTPAQIPCYEVQFNSNARLADPWQVLKLKKALLAHQATDLIILVPGWNNDQEEAEAFSTTLMGHISNAIATKNKSSSNRFLALNIIWPSKKFADKHPETTSPIFITPDAERLQIIEEWIKMGPLLNEGATQGIYKSILYGLSTSANKYTLSLQFSKLIKQLYLSDSDPENKLIKDLEQDDLEQLLNDGTLSYLEPNKPAAVLSTQFEGLCNIINLITYYKIKDRAGKIGKIGLHPLLKNIQTIAGLEKVRLHLIGHSFGARVATAAILGNDQQPLHVQSVALIQAAFSHYSFAENYQPNANGAFRNIIVNKLVKGAFLITHTRADKAVSIAYAIASRIAGQVANATGDQDSLYGGLGSNGAHKTPEVKKLILHNGSSPYGLLAGQVYNVLADGIITDHSDILKPAVGSLVVEAFFAE